MKNLSILILIALIAWWAYETLSRWYWISFGKLAMNKIKKGCYVG